MKSRRKRLERPRVRKSTQNSENGNPRPKVRKDPVQTVKDWVALLTAIAGLIFMVVDWVLKQLS